MFDVFIYNLIGREESYNKSLSSLENTYLQSFYIDGQLNTLRCYEELNKFIAHIIVTENKPSFFKLLEVLIDKGYILDLNLLYILEPLFLLFKPRLSNILKLSKLFKMPIVDPKLITNDDMLVEEINVIKLINLIYKQHIEEDVELISLRDLKRNQNSRSPLNVDKLRVLCYLVTAYGF